MIGGLIRLLFLLAVCYLAAVVLWIAYAAAESVIITFDQHVHVECPGSQPAPWPNFAVERQADGTYRRSLVIPEASRPTCSEPRRWQEEWTARPEDGGHFVREVKP